MHKFTVWAPDAKTVDLALGATTVPMQGDDRGWWSYTDANAGPGTRYGFVIDGKGPALPDPRSQCQPDGVHDLSCVVDHSAFEWTDRNWQARPLASAVIYELHIGTFTAEGTFAAAIDRLDHLVSLGITHVELMPVNAFPGTWGWGYDGVDLFAPHPSYGTPEDLKRLVDAAHRRGLAVILDVVYNHLGPAGNYLSRFGPYFTSLHRTPWGEAVNLDGPRNHEVRRFFCDNALMWLRDYHFDGLRIDAIHALVDNSATHLLEQLAVEVNHLAIHTGRHLVLIAESDLNDPRVVHSREMGGYGIDAQWSDDFHHALHTVITGETAGYYSDFGKVEHLAKALTQVFVYDGVYSQFRQRPHGRPVTRLPKYRFLGYIQNHDQIGNRATGGRISHLAGMRRAKMAAAVVLTAPFIPMLFQGEEWATSSPFQYFTHHEDLELGRAVSEGRRNEFVHFGWNPEEIPDPQDPATYERSKLRWNELSEAPHAEMLAWYQQLIRLRRAHADLSNAESARIGADFDEEQQWLVIERGSIVICCNFSDQWHCLPVSGRGEVLLASTSDVASEAKDGALRIGPETVAIVGTQTEG